MKLLKSNGVFLRLIGLLTLPLILSCVSSGKKNVSDVDYGQVSLNGMIYNQEGLPIKNVTLTIDDSFVTSSDYNGRFTFPDIALGEHTVATSCQGYEAYSTKFYLSRPSEILYISLRSLEAILSLTEKFMDSRDWIQADSCITRALAIQPLDLRTRYLQASLYATKQRKDRSPDKARAILSTLLLDGYSNPSIYLFLADLYQYDYSDNKKAVEYLESYLKQKNDSVIEKRLDELRG